MTGTDYRILLVDDESDVLEALALALRRAKDIRASVDTVSSGPDALERLDAERYHLVMADHRMPGMTGTELLSRVAERHPDVVRALITGFSDVGIALEAVEKARIHYYIQKPWDNEELRVTVLEALAGSWKEKG